MLLRRHLHAALVRTQETCGRSRWRVGVILMTTLFVTISLIIPAMLVSNFTEHGLAASEFVSLGEHSVLRLALPSLALSLSFPILALASEFVKNFLIEVFRRN